MKKAVKKLSKKFKEEFMKSMREQLLRDAPQFKILDSEDVFNETLKRKEFITSYIKLEDNKYYVTKTLEIEIAFNKMKGAGSSLEIVKGEVIVQEGIVEYTKFLDNEYFFHSEVEVRFAQIQKTVEVSDLFHKEEVIKMLAKYNIPRSEVK